MIFNTNFQNSFQDVVCILQNIRMSNRVILKWGPFEYKTKFEKKSLLFRSEVGIFEIFFKTLHEESKKEKKKR